MTLSTTASGFRDGLGQRVFAIDRVSGEPRERLRVRPELAAFETALGLQIDRAAALTDPRFPRARDVDRDRATGQVCVVSDYAAGERLSELLVSARARGVFPDIAVGLHTANELLLAMAAFSGATKMAHGAIAPSRIIISDAADVILTDYLYAPILARLRFSPARLWNELELAARAGAPEFDEAADVRQIALVLIGMALGRPIGKHEYPANAAALVSEVCEVAAISGGEGMAAALRAWLERALNLQPRLLFGNVAHACASFGQIVFDGGGVAGSRAALAGFVDEVRTAPELEEPLSAPPVYIPAAMAAAPPSVADMPMPIVEAPIAPAIEEVTVVVDDRFVITPAVDETAVVERTPPLYEPLEVEPPPAIKETPIEEPAPAQPRAKAAALSFFEDIVNAAKALAHRVERRAPPRAPAPVTPEPTRPEPIAAAPVEVRSTEPPRIEAPSIEPVRFEPPPVEPVRFEPPAIEPAPYEPPPFEAPPFEPVRFEPSPVESARVEPAPFEPAPFEPVRVEPPPIEPVRVEPPPFDAPVEPVRFEPLPIEPVRVEPAPFEPAPYEPPLYEPPLYEPPLYEPAPYEPLPYEPAPIEPQPVAPAAPEPEIVEFGRPSFEPVPFELPPVPPQPEPVFEPIEPVRVAPAYPVFETPPAPEPYVPPVYADPALSSSEWDVEEAYQAAAEPAPEPEPPPLPPPPAPRPIMAAPSAVIQHAPRDKDKKKKKKKDKPEPEAVPSTFKPVVRPITGQPDIVLPDVAPPGVVGLGPPQPAPGFAPPSALAPSSPALPDIAPPGIVPLPPPLAPLPVAPPIAARPAIAPLTGPTPIRLKGVPPDITPRRDRRGDRQYSFSAKAEDQAASPYDAPFIAAPRPSRAAGATIFKIAAAVVVLAAAGFAATKVGWSSATGQPGVLTVESTPTGIDVYIDGSLKGQTPLAISLRAGAHEVKLSRGKATYTMPVTIEAGKQQIERVTWSRVRQAGGLRVTSQPPGAQVYVNGTLQGETPLELPTLAAGRHTVTVQGAGGSVKRTVRVTPGEQTELDVELFSGFLRVIAPVELQLVENGRQLGSSGGDQVLLPSGRHEIVAINEPLGYREIHSVEIGAGETKTITIQPTGTLNVNAVPWAEVWMEGTKIGETPIANKAVPIGTREVLFRHPEHGDRRVVTTVKYNQVTTVTADLTKQ